MESKGYKITLLGTGTSQGVPVIACDCKVCTSADPRDKRLRTSALIEAESEIIVIDTGPDFRQQMLQHHVKKITAVLYTHDHKDHIAGLDDIRAFNFIMDRPVDVYAERRVQRSIKRGNAYIFSAIKYPGIPKIKLHSLKNKEFRIGNLKILPVRAYHHLLPVLGFRFGKFAYLTDVKTISETEKLKLLGLDILVLDTLRKEEHISHMNLSEALELIHEISPGTTYLTHISHAFGLHAEEEIGLPGNVKIGYDGLVLEV